MYILLRFYSDSEKCIKKYYSEILIKTGKLPNYPGELAGLELSISQAL